MVVLNRTQSMFECNVLYIGSAPPIDTLQGTEALQEPLRQRYPGNLAECEGIDSVLRVKSDSLEMIQKGSGNIIRFPLDRLKICAAVRSVIAHDATTGEATRIFVPLNTLQPDTSEPAIFAAIIRRSQGREIAECHAFVCSTPREALHLVNTTAASNLNLKARKGQKMSESVKYQDGVPVIHDVRDDHREINGEEVRYVVEGAEMEQERYHTVGKNTVYVRSSVIQDGKQPEVVQEPDIHVIQEPARHVIQESVRHYVDNDYQYTLQREEEQPKRSKTIYIKFDKSNLVPKGNNTLEVQPGRVQYTAPQPRPMMVQAPPRFIRAPPPPMPVVYRRPITPRPVFVRPPPQSIVVSSPPRPLRPQSVMVPPPSVVVSPPPPPPPPPQTAMIPPPPGRMYARRFMSPPPRLAVPPPVYYRSRARSSSPGYTQSEMKQRVVEKNKSQPKWRSHASDIVEYRQSRLDASVPVMRYPQSEMFMNERAFSRRVNGDYTFNGYPTMGYNYYPGAYDFPDFSMYDRPVSKSNPRYSSSSSEGEDMRFSKKR